jgi:glycosyltransferase involved in cell wall biosynthesis
VLWSREGEEPPAAAVCISLHNYAGRITTALESVAAQSVAALELIVVDDASRDDGAAVAARWLEARGDRFRRALLLRHERNGGLAAARNTAFRAARSPWCFVLDADNLLLPQAVACCLAMATAAAADVAVVHPLVGVVADDAGEGEPAGLISDLPWQREQFVQRNYIDAMALVRRAAWERVGGYSHIPGGWEDYDFWCTLIDAGYHGLLCPRRLAIYHRHGRSMLSRQTAPRLRSISRLLQSRHPWLNLSTARGAQEGWA